MNFYVVVLVCLSCFTLKHEYEQIYLKKNHKIALI